MTVRRARPYHAVAFAALFAAACATTRSAPQEPATPLFQGVAYTLLTQEAPAPQRVHVLELDLDQVRLDVTPGDSSAEREFRAQTVSQYVTARGLQAAVNGGYFTPFKGGARGGGDFYPHTGDPVDVSGASISGEMVASPVELDEDNRVNAVICIEGRAVELRDGQACADGIDHALAAGPRLLANGAALRFDTFDKRFAAGRHPRTAMGLSPDARRAWLVVVDGRQEGVSEGASLAELADIFRRLGASDAINLDGGGSTTMVVAQGEETRLVNTPIHTGVPGRERPAANHLGVRAAPLDDR